MITRRQALAAAAAGPLALSAPALARPKGDGNILADALRAEQLAVYAYAAASTSGLAPRAFFEHESEHVATVSKFVGMIGGPRAQPLRGTAAADAECRRLRLPALSGLSSPRDVRGFLLDLEERLIATWHAAIPDLGDDRLIQTAVGILGCQAQHAVVLRRALGREQLPSALDAGEYPG